MAFQSKESIIQQEKLKRIKEDPVLWAKAYVITYDAEQKKYVRWTARWYQAEMLRDMSRKKVYRCGRRTGRYKNSVHERSEWTMSAVKK